MGDDVLVNKAEIIERCLKRIKEIYGKSPKNLLEDQLKQDAILLNTERACQATIDAAMRIIRQKKLGIPKESREAFTILEQAKIIDGPLATNLRKMVGFRNIAIHEYQELDLKLLQKVIEEDFTDIRAFVRVIVRL